MSNKPLEGLKVVDFAIAGAGPICSKMFADWGADVVKVESFDGDMLRKQPAVLFDWYHMNKRGLVVDAKTEQGREVIYKLVEQSDFFVTNFRPKALKKLQMDYEHISKVNSGIIYGSVTGFGARGPEKDKPGYDITAFWGRSGLNDAVREKGTPPLCSPQGLGDFSLSTALTGPLLAAYIRKLKTGKGEHVSTSLYAWALHIGQWYVMMPQTSKAYSYPASRKELATPMQNTFRTKDGVWFQMVVFDYHKFIPKLFRYFGREDLLGKPGYSSQQEVNENSVEVTAIWDKGFSEHTYDEISKFFDENDFAYQKLNSCQDCLSDEQAWANEMLFKHQYRDGTELVLPATPFKFGENWEIDHRVGPRMGEDTASIMRELGYTEEQIHMYADHNVVMLRSEE